MTPEEFKAKVRERCLEMQKHGYTIAPTVFGIWYDSAKGTYALESLSKKVCPVGACLLHSPLPEGHSMHLSFAASLSLWFGVSNWDIVQFINGFDGIGAGGHPFHTIGTELRQEFVTNAKG